MEARSMLLLFIPSGNGEFGGKMKWHLALKFRVSYILENVQGIVVQ